MLKRILGTSLVGTLLAVSIALAAGNPKVTVCHATSSANHPFNMISVSENAVAAHLGHGDFLPAAGATDCSGGGGPGPFPE